MPLTTTLLSLPSTGQLTLKCPVDQLLQCDAPRIGLSLSALYQIGV